MSTKSLFREQIERRAAEKAARPNQSAFPILRFVLKAGQIDRPVDLIRAFGRFGLKARKAGDIINRLAQNELVPVELSAVTPAAVIETLSSLGVAAWEIKTPDVEPKKVRTALELSQPEFAALYDLELDTL